MLCFKIIDFIYNFIKNVFWLNSLGYSPKKSILQIFNSTTYLGCILNILLSMLIYLHSSLYIKQIISRLTYWLTTNNYIVKYFLK